MLQSAVCIKSNRNHFAKTGEHEATETELKDFAKHVKDNAWENKGTSSAQLKTGWECTGDDLTKAAGFVAAF